MSSLDTINATLPEVFRIIDLTGVVLNGMLGGRLAREKHFDAVGFAVLAIMSALAGGIIRDVMLQAGPPVALTDPYYLATALIGAAIAFVWKMDGKWTRRFLIAADGMVLGTWAATGAAKTLSLGFGIMPALLLGIMTAIGGGMVRDIAAGNVPAVFGGNNLYATPAAFAAIVDVIFFKFDLPIIGMLAATVMGASFTVMAHWRQWRLPLHNDWTISMTPRQWRLLRRQQLSLQPPTPNPSTTSPTSGVDSPDPQAAGDGREQQEQG